MIGTMVGTREANGLKAHREYAGLTQDQLACSARIDRSELSRLERGILRASEHRLKHLAEQLAKPLGLTALEVLSALGSDYRDTLIGLLKADEKGAA